MNILGVSAHYHDSAACLVRDGVLVAAVQEEAFSRRKHDARLPVEAIRFCLKAAGIGWQDLDYIGYYELPDRKLARVLSTHAAVDGRDREQLEGALDVFQRRLDVPGYFPFPAPTRTQVVAIEHHLSHAASAFFPSPFDEAAVLTIDGVGEYTTTSLAHGRGNRVELLRSISFPHSLGLLYSAFTYYTGFRVNSGEYKLMGLSPYGEPTLTGLIEDRLIRFGRDGSFKLNMDYFTFLESPIMIGRKFEELFGAPTRRPDEPIRQLDMDVAKSVQVVLERAVLGLARQAHALTRSRKLCLAGGVALNCVANSRILREGPFDEVWVQPAAGDAGGAVGVATYIHYQHLDKPRRPEGRDAMRGSYLGPSYGAGEVRQYLDAVNARYTVLSDDDLLREVARILASGNVVGWFQGGMEFGPRALGNRSILADPRDREMQRRLNLKIKGRESFRPFAPAVLAEDAASVFDFVHPSPYMLFVAPVAEALRRPLTDDERALRGIDKLRAARSTLPAITHVDGSARLQTVHRDTNPRFHGLIGAFKALTGCPVLVNTSFNVRGEPIVATPDDAFKCFMRTEMDHLVLGNHLLAKPDQRDLLVDLGQTFEAD